MARNFTTENHIVRKIWSKSDTVLLIFAGSAAEFALNKAVDWLYFTGKIPSDPIGRLFSTLRYAHKIIFSTEEKAFAVIEQINAIHSGVEKSRGAQIPPWAFRDVLYMLIYYTISAFELLERKITMQEKEAVYETFLKLGQGMHIPELPHDFAEWEKSYAMHIQNDLEYSPYTQDLFLQYKKHLGAFRYRILLESQKMIVSPPVARMLQVSNHSPMALFIPTYKFLRTIKADTVLKSWLLPKAYLKDIWLIDHPQSQSPG